MPGSESHRNIFTNADQNITFPNMAAHKESIFFRPAKPLDYEYIGLNAADTYDNTPLTEWLSPHRNEYWTHYVRGFRYRALDRILQPRNLTLVACKGSLGGKIIGHIQAIRLGDDAGAKNQIRSRWSLKLVVFAWMFAVWWKVVQMIMGDRSGTKESLAIFLKSAEEDKKLYWENKERTNRWHVVSCVVLKEFQGRGVGKKLLESITAKAEEEGVVVGLEASEEGEHLYIKCGFKLLGRFKDDFGGIQGVGGVMMWSPSGKKMI